VSSLPSVDRGGQADACALRSAVVRRAAQSVDIE
jgi:hypothetical protein